MPSPTPAPSTNLRLGHIRYSNCLPVHARLIDRPEEGDPRLIDGVPSTLNRLLAAEEIDVAPSSSIEYALHADRYRLLPDLVIGSRGPVRSIVFVSESHPADLTGQAVAIPTASATSVVLLKILFRIRWRAEPLFRWFDQTVEDPASVGASAGLFIGDIALGRGPASSERHRFDLGQEWWDETGLPFAFAVWQVSTRPGREPLRDLHRLLLASRDYGVTERPSLARRYAERYSMRPDALERYWNDLTFDLDPLMIEGLTTFYRLAAEIGEIPAVPDLRWIE